MLSAPQGFVIVGRLSLITLCAAPRLPQSSPLTESDCESRILKVVSGRQDCAGVFACVCLEMPPDALRSAATFLPDATRDVTALLASSRALRNALAPYLVGSLDRLIVRAPRHADCAGRAHNRVSGSQFESAAAGAMAASSSSSASFRESRIDAVTGEILWVPIAVPSTPAERATLPGVVLVMLMCNALSSQPPQSRREEDDAINSTPFVKRNAFETTVCFAPLVTLPRRAASSVSLLSAAAIRAVLLPALHYVQRLDFSDNDVIRDADLMTLCSSDSLPCLIRVSIERTHVAAVGAIFGASASLRSLLASGTKIATAEHLSGLERISTLTELDVGYTIVADLCPLRQCAALRSLSARHMPNLDCHRGLAALVQCRALESLDLSRCAELVSPALLGASETLTMLDLSACTALRTVTGLELATSGGRLRTLRLGDCGGLISVTALAGAGSSDPVSVMRASTLECLELQLTRVDDDGIAGLESLPSLARIDVSYTRVRTLARLALSASLSAIRADGCPLLAVGALRGLECTPRLRALSVCATLITDVAGLGGSATVQSVAMKDCREIRTIDGLGSAPQLARLNLSECFRLRSVACLSCSRALEELAIDATAVTSVAGIESIPTLRSLSIVATNVGSVACLGGARQPHFRSLVVSVAGLDGIDDLRRGGVDVTFVD